MPKTEDQLADVRAETDQHSTRQAILRAAADLIPELGWSAVTTRAVAERAGVLNGVVSYHFNTKAELLRAAAIAGLENALAEPTRLLVESPTVSAGVEAVADWLAGDALSGNQVALLTEMMLASRRDEALRTYIASSLAQYRMLLADLLERDARAVGRRATAAARRRHYGTASLIMASIDGLVLHAIADDDFDPRPPMHALAALADPSRANGSRQAKEAR